jgi:radical SAM protein with 4Fe4S-binding SPASM domain
MITDRVHLEMVAVHFSTRCGAACSFCYASDPLAERIQPTPLVEIEKILTKLSSDGVSEILFVGGDPVIHPDFVESLQIAKRLGLKISVLSNSWAIRPLQSFDHAVTLIDSCEATIHGSNAETHDALTQRHGSFTALIKNLQKVASLGKSIGVCTNATPNNLYQIYDIVDVLSNTYRIPIRSLMIQRIVPSGGATGEFKFGLNLNDIDILMRQIDRIVNHFDIPFLFEDPVPWCTVDPQFHKYLARCEWGYTRGAVNSTGFLNRCGADDQYRLGSIWDGNVQDIWKSNPILQSFRSKQYLPHECQLCNLLRQCGGGCSLSCGNMKDHDLDQLYIQRIQKETTGSFESSAPSGKGFSTTSARYAFDGDLQKIVRLEKIIFADSGPLFQADSIKKYFDHCPKAFRVFTDGDKLLGYSVIFPLNQKGKNDVEDNHPPSIMFMNFDGLCQRFGNNIEALYIEVIAVSPEAPKSARISLLKNLIATSEQYPVPVYTCPISDDGLRLVKRFGFVPIQNHKSEKIFVYRQSISSSTGGV